MAGLVGRGCSNQQTAEAHVGNALGKLAPGSRSQLAVWAARYGLLAAPPG